MKFSKAVVFTLFLFGILSTFKAPGDPDFGWHYKYGEYIVQQGQILRQNTFSYTFVDYTWANSYWISQAILYVTHHYLGHLVAGLLFAGVLSAAVIWYVRVLSKKISFSTPLMVFAALLLFVEFSSSSITGRPMYFSSLFLMLLIVVLFVDSKKLFVLPILFLIWANIHADFVLGLFVLGLYIGNKIIEDIKESRRFVLTRSMPLVIVGVFSVVITLINPYGLGLWQTLIKESHPYQFSYIMEWVPASTGNLMYFIVYCATLGVIASSLIWARRKLPAWYILALGFFCIAAVRSQYFFRIAVILGLPAFIYFLSDPLSALRDAFSPGLIKKIKTGLLLFLVLSTLVTGVVFLDEMSQSVKPDRWLKKQGYPKEALDFAFANNLNGNVFNYYGWGGYMIWKYPQVKTFVDGRMPSWREGDKSVFEDYIKIVDAPKKNIQILDDYGVAWVLYPTDSTLAKFLKTPNSGWKEVYADQAVSVFVETTKFDIITP